MGNALFEKLFHVQHTGDVMWDSEVQANSIACMTMFNSAIILIAALLLNEFGVLAIDRTVMRSTVWQGIAELIIPVIIAGALKCRKKWIKYLLLFEYAVVCARIYSILTYNALFVTIMPTVLSARYYRKKLTLSLAITMAVLSLAAVIFGVYFGLPDMNYRIHVEGALTENPTFTVYSNEKTMVDSILYSYLGNALVYLLISLLCYEIAKAGEANVEAQATIIKKTARIQTELHVAKDIQANMLPNIFPAFPESDEFSIYATMTPAKEVGGDFYDFFKVDDSHLAMVIGDVSGKGVPAALFMVIAKTMIQNYAEQGLPVNEVFTKTNKALAEHNQQELFVTAWIGILDLKTGELSFANAGHNPPLVAYDGRHFEYLVSKPNFVLAGMDSTKYREQKVVIQPGSKLYLYTDGVTEATSKFNTLYSEARLQSFLNAHENETPDDVCRDVRKDIDSFAEGIEQFDDITMVAFIFNKYMK